MGMDAAAAVLSTAKVESFEREQKRLNSKTALPHQDIFAEILRAFQGSEPQMPFLSSNSSTAASLGESPMLAIATAAASQAATAAVREELEPLQKQLRTLADTIKADQAMMRRDQRELRESNQARLLALQQEIVGLRGWVVQDAIKKLSV